MVKPDLPPSAIDGIIFFTFELNGSFSQIVLDYLDNRDNTSNTGTYKLTDNNTVISLYRDDLELVKYKVLKFEKDFMKWDYE